MNQLAGVFQKSQYWQAKHEILNRVDWWEESKLILNKSALFPRTSHVSFKQRILQTMNVSDHA